MNLPACEPIAAYADLNHERWLFLRSTGIGGSDAYNAVHAPLSVWMDKTGRLKRVVEGEAVDMGNLLEGPCRDILLPDYLKKKRGFADFEIIPPESMYRSTAHPFMVVNPDGFIKVPATTPFSRLVGLEIKTGSSYMLKEWGGVDGDQVPDRYYYQVQHYLAGTGIDEWWVFGVIGNQRVLRVVPRNEAFIEDLIEKERDLWQLVEINDPLCAPLPMGSDDDMEAVLALGSPQGEMTVDLSEIEHLIARRLDLKAEMDDKAEEWALLDQKIRFVMGQAKYGETDSYKIAHSRWYGSHFDQDRFKREHADLHREYTVVNDQESSRLSVSHKK